MTVVGLCLLQDLHVDGVGVPDLGYLGERLEDEDEWDENRKTLLCEPSDIPNLKNEYTQKGLDTSNVKIKYIHKQLNRTSTPKMVRYTERGITSTPRKPLHNKDIRNPRVWIFGLSSVLSLLLQTFLSASHVECIYQAPIAVVFTHVSRGVRRDKDEENDHDPESYPQPEGQERDVVDTKGKKNTK